MAPRRPACFPSRAGHRAAALPGCAHRPSCARPGPWEPLSAEQERLVRGFLSHRPTFLDHPLTGVLPWSSQLPETPRRIQQVERDAVLLPGEHGPLHRDCNTISPLWGCDGYSAKPCWKTSFIIHRLQTEIIFDNLCRKQAAFWLLASRLKGRKHMFTVRRSPWRKHRQPFNPLPGERAQMFLWNKITTLS